MLTNLILLLVIATLGWVIWRAHVTHVDPFELLKAKFAKLWRWRKAGK